MIDIDFHVAVSHVNPDDIKLSVVLDHTDTSPMLRTLDISISMMSSCAVFFDELSANELTMNVVLPILCSLVDMRVLLLFSFMKNSSFSIF